MKKMSNINVLDQSNMMYEKMGNEKIKKEPSPDARFLVFDWL